ncbi:MAG: acyl-CoA desaturase [Ginsengibacter sp.]
MQTSFTSVNQSPFIKELFQCFENFFPANNLSKKGDWKMSSKIILGLSWWAASYLFLLSFKMPYWQFLLVYLFHGLSQTFLLLNIGHDANHHSITSRPFMKRLLCYVFDLCGLNSYMWRVLHHGAHHNCANVHGEDEALIGRGLFRFSPYSPKKGFHKFQHLYAIFIYGMVSIDHIFLKDFEYFFFANYKHVKTRKYPLKEYVIMIIGKLFYFSYMLILPIVLLGISPWLVLLAFLITHFVMGLLSTLVFLVTHIIDTTRFPESKNEFEHFVYHVLGTTADFSTQNSWANWFLGGLNQHVIHHLCPQICHTHYPKLTQILKATCKEYGIEYRENATMYKAIQQHFKLLKRLGNAPDYKINITAQPAH